MLGLVSFQFLYVPRGVQCTYPGGVYAYGISSVSVRVESVVLEQTIVLQVVLEQTIVLQVCLLNLISGAINHDYVCT